MDEQAVKFWNERYSGGQFAYGTKPNEFLRQYSHFIPEKGKVLCLAEGEGRNAVFLAEKGFDVTAVDISQAGLEKVEKLAKQRNVTVNIVHADLEEYEIEPDVWDGVVSIWCHVPSQLRKKLYQKIIKGLKPGGDLLIESYLPRQIELKTGGPPDPDRLTHLEELKTDLGELKWEYAWEGEREIHEGLYHNGNSAVVQLVARKP